MVDTAGHLVKYGGPKFHWMALDEDGRFGAVALPRTRDSEMVAVGSRPTIVVSSDLPVAIARDGLLYFAELGSDRRLRIVGFNAKGERSVRATLPGTPRWINGIASGPDDSLYYTEDRTVRRIDRSGNVSLVADVRLSSCRPTPGIAEDTQPALRGLAVADDGTVLVAASGCGVLLAITTKGAINPIFRSDHRWSPTAVAVSRQGVYVLEYLHTAEEYRPGWLPRVQKVWADGHADIVATVTR